VRVKVCMHIEYAHAYFCPKAKHPSLISVSAQSEHKTL
jgi:hypothetical protein